MISTLALPWLLGRTELNRYIIMSGDIDHFFGVASVGEDGHERVVAFPQA